MSDSRVSAVTELLRDASLDGRERTNRLLPLVYDELRALARQRMASERPGHSIQATALVHEAYLRLLGSRGENWERRGHFLAAAAEAMRRILVDQARRRGASKRGGDRDRVELDGLEIVRGDGPGDGAVDLAALDEALAALEAEDERKATQVKLRYFTGMSRDEAAAAIGISPATADRDWAYARAFLLAEIRKRRES